MKKFLSPKDIEKLTKEEIIKIENERGPKNYIKIELVIVEARGAWVRDISGKWYLDCIAGYSSNNQGHNNDNVAYAIKNAINKKCASVNTNATYSQQRAGLLHNITNLVPQLAPRFGNVGNKAMLINGGADAVERYYKFARKYGFLGKKTSRGIYKIPDGLQKIIVFIDNFGGRTTSIISSSSHDRYNRGYGGFNDKNFELVEFGNLKATAKAAKDPNVCGIFTEPIQCEGGIKVAPKAFLRGIRDICDENDLIFGLDEIQTGLGRTGKMFCFEHYGIVPDVLLLAKALSGGNIPVSCAVTSKYIMDKTIGPGHCGATYSGAELSCVAANAALYELVSKDLPGRAAEKGKTLIPKLKDLAKKSPHIKEIKGMGLIIGIQVYKDGAKFCKQLLKEGVLANVTHYETIRISPPLTINNDEIKFLIHVLKKVFLKK